MASKRRASAVELPIDKVADKVGPVEICRRLSWCLA